MATVSVMIVLLILGIFATVAIVAGSFSDSLKSRVGFTVIMSDNVTDDDLTAMQTMLTGAPYTNEVTFKSADEIRADWERDNGEDIIEVLGANPFGAEYNVTVNADHAVSDSIDAIAGRIAAVAGVEEVSTTTRVVDGINNFINVVTMIFVPLSLALLLVSCVLINNTVRLTVYSSRFLIHTMKLVGATGAFIRRPFIRTGIVNGIVAGLLAGGLLALVVSATESAIPDIAAYIEWGRLAWVFIAMTALGIAICGISAALSTNKYLRLDYDDMF